MSNEPDPESGVVLATAWAVFTPEGHIICDSTFDDVDRALTVSLGWPHQDEIDHFYKRGGKVLLVKLVAA